VQVPPVLPKEKPKMSRISFPIPSNGDSPDHLYSSASSRRSTALAAAAAVWPSSGGLFAEEFLADTFQDENDELSDLLSQVEAFSQSPSSGPDDLFKFRQLLLEASQSVFLRWKVLHQLRTMALTDELTGLYNRRGFLLLGSHNVRLALRTTQPLFLFFADVDGLKQINDQCGHVQGDALLIGCAEVLKMTFRESDIVSRLGGDEFAILTHGNSNESRSAVLNRLKSSIDLMNRDVLAPYQLSLSVGVATFDPLNPVSLTELLSIADREMMARKPPRPFPDSSSSYLPSSNGNSCLHA
jgi:diguanylate cyclase (GGDEF)-like protein